MGTFSSATFVMLWADFQDQIESRHMGFNTFLLYSLTLMIWSCLKFAIMYGHILNWVISHSVIRHIYLFTATYNKILFLKISYFFNKYNVTPSPTNPIQF